MAEKIFDVIIIGGGPAGLTAAVYCERSGKSALIIEKAAFGGQITWSPKVENFPTIVSASGAEIGDRMLEQAMEQGAEVELNEVVKIEKNDSFSVTCSDGAEFKGKAVIIATGAKPRTIGIENEEQLIGNGVCFCAVCDGAFYTGKDVIVYGGGNSALQDAVLLSEKCKKVYLVHRRDAFRGEAKLVDILKSRDNVEIILNSTISELFGEGSFTGAKLEQDGKTRTIDADGLFVAIGHIPDNEIFRDYITLDEAGYALSAEDCITSTDGLFAAGDCRKKKVHQLTTAVADGATAALAACEYIDRNS